MVFCQTFLVVQYASDYLLHLAQNRNILQWVYTHHGPSLTYFCCSMHIFSTNVCHSCYLLIVDWEYLHLSRLTVDWGMNRKHNALLYTSYSCAYCVYIWVSFSILESFMQLLAQLISSAGLVWWSHLGIAEERLWTLAYSYCKLRCFIIPAVTYY